ncbi:MAG TPA: hypothetical protein VIV58_00235 [Kofleriaceae bacterium]
MRSLLFIAALATSACTGAQSTGITESQLTCDTSLTYASFGQAFISTNCSECHAGKDSPNLSTQAGVKSNSSRILQAAVYTTAMPQNADISNDERMLLGQWLTCGAP